MVILENIDIDTAILQNIDIDKISNRFKFGISNRATPRSLMERYGGADGSNGDSFTERNGDDHEEGGKGSCLNLGTLKMSRFVLTPGKAVSSQNGYGGGGGGIQENKEKPQLTLTFDPKYETIGVKIAHFCP